MHKRKKVLVFRDHLFAVSETFVYRPYPWIRSFEPVFFGSKFASQGGAVQSSAFPADHVFTLQRSGKSLREALFKLFGRLPSDAITWLRRHQPVLIHAHFAPDGVLSLPLARRLRIPLVVSLLGSDITMKESHVLRSSYPTHRLYLFRKKRLFRQAHRFIVPSRFLWNVALERGYPEDKLLLLPHGVDTRFFTPEPEAVVPGRILFVGRLVALKGPHLLLEAARRLMTEFPDLHVVMVGEGPERPRLEAWAEKHLPDRVRFLGVQPPEVVRREMQKAWVFSMPSVPVATGQAESFGMVFLEAQACGCPVVTFSTGGIPEVVRQGETGFLVPPGDVEGLTRALRKLLLYPDLRHRMGETARQWVVSRFDIRDQAKALEDLYEVTLTHAFHSVP